MNGIEILEALKNALDSWTNCRGDQVCRATHEARIRDLARQLEEYDRKKAK